MKQFYPSIEAASAQFLETGFTPAEIDRLRARFVSDLGAAEVDVAQWLAQERVPGKSLDRLKLIAGVVAEQIARSRMMFEEGSEAHQTTRRSAKELQQAVQSLGSAPSQTAVSALAELSRLSIQAALARAEAAGRPESIMHSEFQGLPEVLGEYVLAQEPAPAMHLLAVLKRVGGDLLPVLPDDLSACPDLAFDVSVFIHLARALSDGRIEQTRENLLGALAILRQIVTGAAELWGNLTPGSPGRLEQAAKLLSILDQLIYRRSSAVSYRLTATEPPAVRPAPEVHAKLTPECDPYLEIDLTKMAGPSTSHQVMSPAATRAAPNADDPKKIANLMRAIIATNPSDEVLGLVRSIAANASPWPGAAAFAGTLEDFGLLNFSRVCRAMFGERHA